MAIIPDLEANGCLGGALPRGSEDLKDGYILLRVQDKHRQCLRECEVEALQRFSPTLSEMDIMFVRRWARLRIPNGQICYSAWKELQKPLEKRRTVRNVKVSTRFP